MPNRISITTDLNISELEQLYRQAKNAVESRKARRGKLPPADFTSISSYMVISAREKNCYMLRKLQGIAEHGYTHWSKGIRSWVFAE